MSDQGIEKTKMSDNQKEYSRREALASIRKYAVLSGAAVVVLSADSAVQAQASSQACGVTPPQPPSCPPV